MTQAMMPAHPEYAKSLAFIKRAGPKRAVFIFSKRDRLRVIFAQHKGTIKHRWEKRKLLLMQAWGEGSKIPSRRTPNFDAYERGLRGDQYKWAYLLPMVNLEDLSDRVNLMLLLESRAINNPSAFAGPDTSTIHMACENGVTVLETSGHTMLLTEEPQESYGTIVSWRETAQLMSLNWSDMYEGRVFNLGQGFLYLEIPGRILEFLVAICHGIATEPVQGAILGNALRGS